MFQWNRTTLAELAQFLKIIRKKPPNQKTTNKKTGEMQIKNPKIV